MFKKDEKENLEDFDMTEGEDADDDIKDTIIAQGVKVEGDFNSKGNVIIEGTVVGSVKTNNNLQVGEKAKITASISAHDAHISGEVQGNVKVKEKLELSPTSKIYGDIEAKTLIIVAGAIFNGKCAMTDQSAPSRGGKKLKKAQNDREEK